MSTGVSWPLVTTAIKSLTSSWLRFSSLAIDATTLSGTTFRLTSPKTYSVECGDDDEQSDCRVEDWTPHHEAAEATGQKKDGADVQRKDDRQRDCHQQVGARSPGVT